MSMVEESDAVKADVSEPAPISPDAEASNEQLKGMGEQDVESEESAADAALPGDAATTRDTSAKAAAPVLVEPSAVPNDSSSIPLPQRLSSIPPASVGSPRMPQSASLPTPTSAQASPLPSAHSLPSSATPKVSSPAPRRPAAPTKGILKPPPPPPKPTFGNRLRDLAANVVGTAPAVHPGGIGGRGMYEPSVQAQVQAQAQANARDQAGAAGASDKEIPGVRRTPGGQAGQHGEAIQRPAEQRLQEVSAAVGGTLNALGGRIGLGFSRFVNAATNGNNVSGNGNGNSATTTARSASPLPSTTNSTLSLPSPTPSTTGRTSAAVRSLFDFDTSEPLSLARISSAASVESEKSRKQPLRRATFVLPSLSIVYPISTYGEPWSLKVTEDRKRVESSHRSLISATTGAQYWTSHRLVLLYETACKGREERSRVGIVRALDSLPSSPRPRALHLFLRPFDLSQPSLPPPPYTLDTPLTRHAAEALADVLTIEWGLAELKLEGGMVEDEASLKSILHALLISGTLPMLSLRGSRRVRSGGWRLLAVFMRKARSLRYIDLSDTSWDKRGMEYFVQALSTTASPSTASPSNISTSATAEAALGPATTTLGADAASQRSGLSGEGGSAGEGGQIGSTEQAEAVDAYGSFLPPAPLLRNGEDGGRPAAVQTLRMDECNLRHNVLEILANGIRSSDVKNLSLRRNRIGPLGGVSLAVMIRDHNESTPAARMPAHYARVGDHSHLADGTSLPLPSESAPDGRIGHTPTGSSPPIESATGGQRLSTEARLAAATASAMESDMTTSVRRDIGRSDSVKRLGGLLTLDLKGNDIRSGVQYIAQVLKRNRTLKVLNLSDNRIDAAGLAVLAEALKYNSTLETLDLSSNPCCAPGLEGVFALRSALSTNKTLKRLFLSDTGLTAEGAISIAECLPDASSILHFDLTENPIDLAGAIALSSGLKSNGNIRCLDVTIMPSDADMADASQSILQTCIRNTEAAVAAATAKADTSEGASRSADALWLPIKRSTLVRQAKEADEYRADQARIHLATSIQGLAREYVYKLSPAKLVPAAERTGRDLEKWLAAGRLAKRPGWNGAWQPGQLPKDDFEVLVERAQVLKERLVDEAQRIPDDGAGDGDAASGQAGMDLLIRIIELKESIEAVLDDARGFTPPPRILLPSQIIAPTAPAESNAHIGNGQPPHPIARHRRHVRGTSLEISSPNFSIGDSDNDSDADAEEVDMDMARLASPASRNPAVPGLSKLRTHSELGSSSTTSPGGSIGGRSRLGQRTQSHQPGSATSILAQLPNTEAKKDKRPEIGVDTRLELPPGDETDAVMAALLEAANSPQEETERSRKWVEEEGEVFRKSTKLGVVKSESEAEGEKGDEGKREADEEERVSGDDGVSGEALKQEILDTEVARDHERRVIALADDDDNETRREDDDSK